MSNPRRRTIWIVDDSPTDTQRISSVLRADYDVKIFLEPAAALEALMAETEPDLLVLDWVMPGLSGLEFCKYVRSAPGNRSQIPILLLTAQHGVNEIIEAFKSGANDYVVKPFVEDELKARVRSLISTQQLRERAEAAELKADQQFRSIFSNAGVAMVVTDAQGRMQKVNRAYCELLGYSEAELLSMTFSDVTESREREQNRREVMDLVASDKTHAVFEKTYQHKNGHPVYVRMTVSILRDSNRKAHSIIAVVADLTSERKALKTVERNSALMKTVMEQIPAAVIIAEAPSGKLIFANNRLNDVWRHPLKPSNNIAEYADWVGFHPDGRRYEGKDWPLARAISNGEVVVNEDTHILRGDGTHGIIRLSAAPVRNASNEIIAGVVICEDVTEQKSYESNLKRAKEEAERANQFKSAFLANMSHEIRTPLGAMLGYADLMRDPTLTPMELSEYVEVISRNGHELSAIINDILDLSKIEAGRLTIEYLNCDLAQVAGEVLELFRLRAKEKKVALNLVVDSSASDTLVTDRTRIRQVLVNLVGNALKFTRAGSITIKIKSAEAGTRIIEVTDTGIGIAKSQWEKIFDVFVQADGSMTRKFGGTGLGLSLSRRLARELGGDLKLTASELGVGSTFTLVVRDHAEKKVVKERADIPTKDVSGDVSFEGRTILVVDDAPDNQHLLSRYLTKRGAVVDLADNGLIGYQKGISKKYDVILMDIQMPVMDGYAVTQKLRAEGITTPIIALTAHAMSEVRENCIEAGCSEYLPKPINPSQLIAAISRYV